MALEAKRGLFGFEQFSLGRSLMHGMAGDAAYVGLGVGGTEKVGVSSCVATQAGGIHCFSGGYGRIEYLRLVAARFHMRFAGPVTALAGNARAAMLQCQLGMRI